MSLVFSFVDCNRFLMTLEQPTLNLCTATVDLFLQLSLVLWCWQSLLLSSMSNVDLLLKQGCC